jgi:hypothetical protein
MTGEPHQPSERTLPRRKLNERLRRAFIEGAEEQSQRDLGRPLTAEELRRILAQYPGDPPERGEG